MPAKPFVALGLDFGTESVRALLVDGGGAELGSAVARYRHGQIAETLPNSRERLAPLYALQDPQDWLDSSAAAVRAAMRRAKLKTGDVVSIGVDFTSCTMLPTLGDGTPLCQLKEFAQRAAGLAEAMETPRREAAGRSHDRSRAAAKGSVSSKITAARSGWSGFFPRF